jgi:hypothetical protein
MRRYDAVRLARFHALFISAFIGAFILALYP